CQQYNSNPLSF
nr:immunoglobulin light chain junction region [Macaca mulatta]MPN82403.1 immunoglobulin light chain junction region [Macaca mulatta]